MAVGGNREVGRFDIAHEKFETDEEGCYRDKLIFAAS